MAEKERTLKAFTVLASQTAALYYGALYDKSGDHESARAQAIYWVGMVIAALDGASSVEGLPIGLQRDAEVIVDEVIAQLYPSRSGKQN